MRIDPIDEKTKPELDEIFQLVEGFMGFRPNSLRVMARHPVLMNGFMALSGGLLGPDTKLDGETKQLAAYAASLAAGCLYCQAHTAHGAEKAGAAREKLRNAWNYERSDLFSERERAVMRLAQNAASVPNSVSDDDIVRLRAFYEDDAIVELLGVVALFGFLNRWNDSLATELEDRPKGFALANLGESGWDIGKHGE